MEVPESEVPAEEATWLKFAIGCERNKKYRQGVRIEAEGAAQGYSDQHQGHIAVAAIGEWEFGKRTQNKKYGKKCESQQQFYRNLAFLGSAAQQAESGGILDFGGLRMILSLSFYLPHYGR